MIIETKAFGPMEIDERQIIQFRTGILGFTHLKEYALIDSQQPPFFILQAIQDRDTSFIIMSPEVFRSDYGLDLASDELDELEWEDDEELLVMAIVTIPQDGSPITANLQGPVIINKQKRLGKQAIQLSPIWKTRHLVLEEMAHKGGAPC